MPRLWSTSHSWWYRTYEAGDVEFGHLALGFCMPIRRGSMLGRSEGTNEVVLSFLMAGGRYEWDQ